MILPYLFNSIQRDPNVRTLEPVSQGTGSPISHTLGATGNWTPVGILDNSCMGDMSEAGGWHAVIQVIHSRHQTWLATSRVPSLADFSASPFCRI